MIFLGFCTFALLLVQGVRDWKTGYVTTLGPLAWACVLALVRLLAGDGLTLGCALALTALCPALCLLGLLGWGDVALMVSVVLSAPLGQGLLPLGLGWVIGGLWALVALALGRVTAKSAVPLVPFLAVGYGLWLALTLFSTV